MMRLKPLPFILSSGSRHSRKRTVYFSTMLNIFDCYPRLPKVWSPETSEILWPDEMNEPDEIPVEEIQAIIKNRFLKLNSIPISSCTEFTRSNLNQMKSLIQLRESGEHEVITALRKSCCCTKERCNESESGLRWSENSSSSSNRVVSITLKQLARLWRHLFVFRVMANVSRQRGVRNQFIFGTSVSNEFLRKILQEKDTDDKASQEVFDQLLENEFHAAWIDGYQITEAVLGFKLNRMEFLLLGMMDDYGDPTSFFANHSTLREASLRLSNPHVLRAGREVNIRLSDPWAWEVLWWSFQERAVTRLPVPAILGVGFFSGLTLCCDSTVHVPHKYTEMYTEWLYKALDCRSSNRELVVLDMCCGNGCIALALLKHSTLEAKSVRKVIGYDINPNAISLAVLNAKRLGFPPFTAEFVVISSETQPPPATHPPAENLFPLKQHLGCVDVIVGNVPRMASTTSSDQGRGNLFHRLKKTFLSEKAQPHSRRLKSSWEVTEEGYPQYTDPSSSQGSTADGLSVLRIIATQGPKLLRTTETPPGREEGRNVKNPTAEPLPNLLLEYHDQGVRFDNHVKKLFQSTGWSEVKVISSDGVVVLSAVWR